MAIGFVNNVFSTGVRPTSERLIKEYVEILHNCKWNSSAAERIRDCAKLTENELADRLQIAPEVTFVVKAVSAFSAALFLVQVEHCQGHNISQCIHLTNVNLQQEILSVLSQLSFTSQHKAPFELQGTSLHLTHDGQLISNKYVVFYIRESGDVSGAGWYSDEQGLVIDERTGPIFHHKKFINREKQGKGFEVESYTTATIREFFEKDSPISQSDTTASSKFGDNHGAGVNAHRVTPESSMARSWATILVAIAAVGICITMFILVYVLIKICDGTLAGNQSLGVILLLGIMTLYASVVIFVLPASESRCTLRAFVYPITMSLCYGILIIKVMQLRSLVLLGLGGRISYINQYIILFFIVLVQVVINLQWYLTNRPQFRIDSEGSSYCYMPRTDFLLLHLYITILVIIAFLYGLTVLKIRRNYKEGHWVTLASFLTMPVLVTLGLVYSFVPEKYDDPLVCVTLISLATVLVLVIFIPKMNTISNQNMHFKQKKLHMSDSVTTVFTTLTDLHNSSVNESKKKGARLPHRTSHLGPNMLDAYTDNITKNPIYEVTSGAYP